MCAQETSSLTTDEVPSKSISNWQPKGYDPKCLDNLIGPARTDELLYQKTVQPNQSELDKISVCLNSPQDTDLIRKAPKNSPDTTQPQNNPQPDGGGLNANEFDIACLNTKLGTMVVDEIFYTLQGRQPTNSEMAIIMSCSSNDITNPRTGSDPKLDQGASSQSKQALLTKATLKTTSWPGSTHSVPDNPNCTKSIDNICQEVVWSKIGELMAGAFTSIEFSPADSNVVYAGIDSNDMSLYRSTDGGRSWNLNDVTGHTSGIALSHSDPNIALYSILEGPVRRTNNLGEKWTSTIGGPKSVAPNESIFTAIAFAPSDDNIAYTATTSGDQRSGSQNGPVNVYRSNNSGIDWNLTGSCYDCGGIKTIAVDPLNPEVIWVASNNGPHVSRDGGRNWSKNLLSGERNPYSFGIAINPNNTQNILLASTNNGVYRTEDGGKSWQQSNSGIIDKRLHSIKFALSDGNIAYVASHSGVYRSEDSGKTWQNRSNGLDEDFITPLAVHPTNPNIVLAGTASEVYTTHPAHFKPGRNAHEGLYRTEDGGKSWSRSDAGIHEPMIAQMATHPHVPFMIWADGQSGRGAFVSENAGDTWEFSPSLASHYPMVFAHSQQNPSSLYLTSWQNDGELMVSEDWGSTWVDLTHRIEAGISDDTKRLGLWDPSKRRWFHLHAVAVAPSNANIIYVGSVHDNVVWPSVEFNLRGSHIFKSEDGGKSFSEMSTGFPIETPTAINSIVIHPTNPNIAYAMTSLHEAEEAIGIYKTSNGGLNWIAINNGLDHQTNDIQMDPLDPTILYTATESGIFKTDNAGLSWQKSSTGIPDKTPVIDLAMDAQNPMNLYAITPNSIYRTKNGGGHWYSIDYGIPKAQSGQNGRSAQDRLLGAMQLDVTRTGHSMYGGTFAQDRTLEIDHTGSVLYVVAKTKTYDDWRSIRYLYRAIIKDHLIGTYKYTLNTATFSISSNSNVREVWYDPVKNELAISSRGPMGLVSNVTLSGLDKVLGKQPDAILNKNISIPFSANTAGQITLQIEHQGEESIIVR